MRYELILTVILFTILTSLGSCGREMKKETTNEPIQLKLKTEQKIEKQNNKDLISDPPISLSDIKSRIDGTVWEVKHDNMFCQKVEFKNGKIYNYEKWLDGSWKFNDSYDYTITDEGTCFKIDFGDGSDDDHLETTIWIYKDGSDMRFEKLWKNTNCSVQLVKNKE